MARKRPGYREISRYYEHLIRTGKLRPGESIPIEDELARRHEVTRTTIRRAFSILVRKGLVQKVQGRGSIVTPEDEFRMRQQSHVVIAAPQTITSVEFGGTTLSVDIWFRYGYLEALIAILAEFGRPFRVHYLSRDPRDLAELAQDVRRNADLGIIAFDVGTKAELDRLRNLRVPTVFLDCATFGRKVDTVRTDDRGGTRQATLHLLKTTGGPVVFVGPPWCRWPGSPHHERLEGFREAHRECGREVRKDRLLVAKHDDTVEGRQIGHALLRCPELPLGIVCSDDVLV